MIANPSVVDLIFRVLFLFGYALLFALAEIEIEGEHGWAERLPTWFRVTTPGARLYRRIVPGKPLTGYHLVMFAAAAVELPHRLLRRRAVELAGRGDDAVRLSGLGGDLGSAVVPANPRYGWSRFRKGEIWWHAGTWIGRFPIDYWGGLIMSLAIAASARLATGDFGVLGRHVVLVAGFGGLMLLINAAAPRYMRWHAHMRRPGADERAAALPPSNGNGANGDGNGTAYGPASATPRHRRGLALERLALTNPLPKRERHDRWRRARPSWKCTNRPLDEAQGRSKFERQ